MRVLTVYLTYCPPIAGPLLNNRPTIAKQSYSTVTLLAKFRGRSGLLPRNTAAW